MSEVQFIETIIGVGILLFAAKLMAELFLRLKLPIVLGELIAGMIVGPFALGGLQIIDGKQLLQINDEIRILGEMGAIVILFMAGLEMTPKEFLKGGKAAFVVGTLGVVIPFFVGLTVFQLFGFDALQSMLIATALTATSIAISIQVLSEFGKIKTPEARLIIGAAIVDDILAIAVLSVVTSIAGSDGGVDNIDITEIVITILQVLGFFAIMLIVAVVVIPKVITPRIWKAKGSVEGIATAAFFGAAALAGSIGLSPIVGAFAVGMALSTTKVFDKIENYVGKIGLIFAPLFFAIIGAQVDLRAVDLNIMILSGVIIIVAVTTKLFGCGLPAMYFLKSKQQGLRVGIGMISRGEVGLIVAGVGVTAGILTSEVYSTIIIMVVVTTIITPIWLKIEYRKEQKNDNNESNKTIEPKSE
ncbi:MAG TPA: cation:proton antiporter [Nitrosopumilus sp.]|jgi:Kef-type K+ transport system membrane component KefB|nr:MAG: potassium transporter Kef [Nitrosopumilus sp. BACL13 MAG-121220-bin23]KRO32217.1 MAG: potassium transporter Kef [Nitrosopumilus sp. BACL13 MAG-120910-bin56]HIH99319.1 cation:proton antiporter [Nitrosopumilus sp.]HII04642.1 cation:proton antiporter [Nitrosopumilus sp.]